MASVALVGVLGARRSFTGSLLGFTVGGWLVSAVVSLGTFAFTGEPRHLYPLHAMSAPLIGFGFVAGWRHFSTAERGRGRLVAWVVALMLTVLFAGWAAAPTVVSATYRKNGQGHDVPHSYLQRRHLLSAISEGAPGPPTTLWRRVRGVLPMYGPLCPPAGGCEQILHGLRGSGPDAGATTTDSYVLAVTPPAWSPAMKPTAQTPSGTLVYLVPTPRRSTLQIGAERA